MRFVWAITLLCGLLGGLIIFVTMIFAKGAPQEAAGYAMACAVTVVPYIFTRAAQALSGLSLDENTSRIVEAIARANPKRDDAP